jgi:hypothetical protein
MPTLSFTKEQLLIAIRELYLRELIKVWGTHQIFLPIKYDSFKVAKGTLKILELEQDVTNVNRICESKDILISARNQAYVMFKEHYRTKVTINNKEYIKKVISYVIIKFIQLNKGKLVNPKDTKIWEQIEVNIELKIAAPSVCGLSVLGKHFTRDELKNFIKQVERNYNA